MSFFKTLFDFSFTEFVTTKIIKFLYIITIVLAAILWFIFLVTMFASGRGFWGVLLGIIGAPIGFVLQVIFTRVSYEILIVVFGIAENTRNMAWALTGGRKAPSATSPAQPQVPQYPQQPPAPQYPQYPQQPQQPPAVSQNPQYPQQPGGGQQLPPQQPGK